ncbi:uncharacterized protein LOC131478857, partial [Ochotona princeps]|uniref:uncharacterized protein LOC131478857 n=1 Tax=Ochotona princeps TaxID=9978 RepID=UPI0027155BA1
MRKEELAHADTQAQRRRSYDVLSSKLTVEPRVTQYKFNSSEERYASAAVDPSFVSTSGVLPTKAEGVSSARPQRPRRPPRKFEVDESSSDSSFKKALEKSRLETRRMDIDYASLPSIPEIKFASSEDFLVNPVAFYERLERYGREFGGVKIVPPEGWRPPFCLRDLLDDALEFNVRVQDIHKLMQGAKFGHPPATERASGLQAKDRQMKRQHFGTEKPLLHQIEALYWQSVETSVPELTVHYAADLKTNEVGSGFPTQKTDGTCCVQQRQPGVSGVDADRECTDAAFYAAHPWNLTRFARQRGSLLSSYHRDVAGVTSPWLYVGMIFSTFCWHAEDNYFAACNYHHWGRCKLWYVIPPSRAPSVERMLQRYLNTKDSEYVLHSLTVQLPPSLFIQHRVPVYRVEQKENEFIMLWPRTYHAGFNAGFNCNEACNFAPASWLPWGHRSIYSYRFMRSTCIPFHQLLLRAACNAGGLAASQLLHMCQALLRLLHEEYALRRTAKEERVATGSSSRDHSTLPPRGNMSAVSLPVAQSAVSVSSMKKRRVAESTTGCRRADIQRKRRNGLERRTTAAGALQVQEKKLSSAEIIKVLVRQLTWRYFLSALKDEEEDNDERILPVF